MFKAPGKSFLLVTLLTVIGAIFHFYNINWGAPYYFHPDERNIASAVSQLLFPGHMNPQFFAYGSLPIYAIYFTGILTNFLLNAFNISINTSIQTVSFAEAIIIGRVYSALFATLLIPILYSIGKKLGKETTGLLCAFFATTSVGFIQFSHFGTFEMWLTFFSVLLFIQCLAILQEKKWSATLFMAIVLGVLVAIKVSSLALVPLPLVVLLWSNFGHYIQRKTHTVLEHTSPRPRSFLKNSLHFIKETLLVAIICAAIFLATNPYTVLDTKDFQSSMNYESGVALGTEPVFYTQNFMHTIPGIYQVLHVYPFLLNPLMTVLFLVSFFYGIFMISKHKNKEFILLIAFYLFLFSSQAFFFVKWTRYMVPTLPFIFLIVAVALGSLLQKNKNLKGILHGEMMVLIILNSLVALSYLVTAFIGTDTRIAAVQFAQKIIPPDAKIVTEPSDLGVVPFQDAFTHIDTFNFYDLDNNSPDATETQLQQKLQTSQYIIIPSQRLLQSRIENPAEFPKGYTYYKDLFNGTLGYHKIYETPCDIFCTITYLGDPVYWWEQTASVFERPTLFIFEKNS